MHWLSGTYRKIKTRRQGEAIIVLNAIVWGFFPVLILLTYQSVAPLDVLAWNSFFAMLFFAFLVTFKKQWHQVFDRRIWKDVLYVAFFLGILLYALYYSGLRYTSAGNASLIGQTEIFFSYLFFQVWKKDKLSMVHGIGAFLMVVGAIIVLLPNFTDLQMGDLLILAAMACAPFGNYFAQRARKKVSSETVLFVRSFISTPFLFILAALFGQAAFSSATIASLPLLALYGVAFFGVEKILWLEGIHRIPVTKANAITCITPLITLLTVWVLQGEIPTPFQVFSIIPLGLGLILLTMNGQREQSVQVA